MTSSGLPLRLGLIGPLPPPSGGMANQCRQLRELLTAEGVIVELVQVNAPYRPAWAGRLRGVRALFRLLPYLADLWRASGRNDVLHLMANSGWAWHLCAAPAIWIARLRGTPIIVNYRGGEAAAFFARAPRWVHATLARANRLVVPSGYLEAVFGNMGFKSTIIPNIINMERFKPRVTATAIDAPHLIVTRNLEPIYDIPTALTAFAVILREFPRARLTVAGSGPERGRLETMAHELGLAAAVNFCGRVDNQEIPALYASADLMLNPSTVDNMPISILEAFASGVPVVSTDVGGVPYVARHGHSALLVPPRDPTAMAAAALQLLRDSSLTARLIAAAKESAARYAWPEVRAQWLLEYQRLCRSDRPMEAA
ncbi:MAG: glycosyltransferase family 4 protein [Rhodocyclaceae bacterium]|nr:glycosyltransferase family 4 protein [Rhodocyclaceae bacterium]MBX3667637.1 glycosyltransferase family 4 protein [Rhodocyclaceae bacterium]